MELNWFPGHMMKALREMEAKLKLIDLIVEVVDARIVFSSANPILNRLAANKPKLLLINKADIADSNVTKLWIDRLKAQNCFFVLTDAKHVNLKDVIIAKIMEVMGPKLQRDKMRGIRNSKLKIMVVGIPNVGKSTVINNLVSRNVARIGNQPGVTKGQQWLKVNQQIDLLDTPGVLWPKMNKNIVAFKLALANSIAMHVLPMEALTNYGLNWLRIAYPMYLQRNYKIDDNMPLLVQHGFAKEWNDELCETLFCHIAADVFKMNSTQTEHNTAQARKMFLSHLWAGDFGKISFETPSEVDSYE